MKYISALIFTCLIYGVGIAQTAFICSPSNTVTTAIPFNSYTPMGISQVNQTNDTLTLAWTLISNDMPSGWDYSLCDYPNCYIGIPASGLMDPISGPVQGFFTLNINPFTITAVAKVEIWVYDLNNPADGDTVTFNIDAHSAVGISDNTYNSQRLLYPNPTSDIVNLPSNVDRIMIYDITGALVVNNEMRGLLPKFDVSDLNNGTYFIQITEGSNTYTRTFIKE